jgi:hypothetical protein
MWGKFHRHGHLSIGENPSTRSGRGVDLGSISNWKQIVSDHNGFVKGMNSVGYELGSRAAWIGDAGLRRERCCWAVVPA